MRSLQLMFVLILSVFLLQSCEKESLEEINQSENNSSSSLVNVPLENLPEEITNIREFPKIAKGETVQAEPELMIEEGQAQSRNPEVQISFIPPDPSKLNLSCGVTFFGSTIGESNLISNSTYRSLGFRNTNLNGSDQLYAIQMDRTDVVRFDLTGTRQNLAMVLYEGDYDFNRRELILRRIVSWTTSSSSYGDYIGPVTLTPGNYILVVDGAPNRSSDYRVTMTCNGGGGSGSQSCDDMDSYYLGDISNQSFKWEKWENSSPDGQITNNSYGNQFLKMEARNYGSQPDVIYKTGRKTNGNYRFSADMWIYRNRSGYMNIQKRLRSEWGGQIFFNTNGTGVVKINGKNLTFNYPQSKWMEVDIEFDFTNNRTRLYIDGQYKAGWSVREYSNGSYGSYQIEGINFYAASSSDQVFVDNVCFD